MSEIRWTRGWHERAKVEVANGAHLDRDESELALAEIERAWGEIDVIRTAGGPDVAGLHDDAHGQNCLGCLVGYALSEYEREGTRMAAEIERLSKERGELLAEATAATNQISDMHAEIERLKSTKSAALEKYMAEARDLRVTVCWAVDRNDLASAPIETVLSLLRGRAPAPLTEAEAQRWFDLEYNAWQRDEEDQRSVRTLAAGIICRASRDDIPADVRAAKEGAK